MVISIGNGVLKDNDRNTLSEFGDQHYFGLEVSYNQWTGKRKGATGKIELSRQLLAGERFIFQESFVTVIYDYDISSSVIINLDQTPLS